MRQIARNRGKLLARSCPRTPFRNFDRRTCLRAAGLLALLTLTALPLLAADPDELYRAHEYRAAQKAYGELDLKHPQTVRYRYNRGCAAYQAGDYAAAQAAFKSSLTRATDAELRYRCCFNLGNTAFKQGDYRAAAGYYRQALRLRPGDNALKANLELALHRLGQQRQSKNQPKQGQTGQKQPGQNRPQGGPQQQPPNQQPESQGQARNQPSQAQQPNGQPPHPNKNIQAGATQKPQLARAARSALDRQRAAALIESVRENRPAQRQDGELPASGKYW